MISMVAVGVLLVHAVWCLFCKRVSDGIVGKALYGLLSLAGLGYLSNPDQGSVTLLLSTLAAISIRHFWMKTYWPSIKARMIRGIYFAHHRSHAHVSAAKPQSDRR